MAECAIVVENEYWYHILMKICLSHCGWMVTRHLVNTVQLRLGILPRNDLLLDLSTGWHVPNRNSSLKNAMLTVGLLVQIDDDINLEEVQLRYKRNREVAVITGYRVST